MKKILLAEDELGLRENIIALLEIRGYEVVPALDGMDALKKLRSFTPDLIISDIMMPYLDGYELFKRVREDDRTKFIPFLFLSAKSDLSSIRQGMGLGVDDYITKPFSSEDLLRSINIQLQKAETVNLKIDQIRSNIRESLPHELRTPLVGILGFSEIILNENQILNKEEIIEMVERINISARRLHNRIEKFLQLTELDLITKTKGEVNLAESPITSDQIKQKSIEHMHIKNRMEDINIKIDPAFLIIPSRVLNVIVIELIENAVKFSTPGTPINVDGRKDGEGFLFSVTDQGFGMEDDEIKSIGEFNQFNRGDYTFDGNGLGLTFVKRAVNLFGGSVQIVSSKKIGTTVLVNFQIAH